MMMTSRYDQWVDPSDPAWIASRDKYTEANTMGKNKFRDWHELLFSMRSVYQYAPWVRTIFIVTAGQTPNWLAEHPGPRVRIVHHNEIFDDPDSQLPTFNSLAIGACFIRLAVHICM